MWFHSHLSFHVFFFSLIEYETKKHVLEMFSWRLTVFFEVQGWKISIKLEYEFLYFKPEINQSYLNVYFKCIKILRVLNFTIEKKWHFADIFAIWREQNISRVFNFAILVKIKNESLIVNQCNCYQICYTSIIIIIWLNIRKKRIPKSAGL